jgi:putative inorganic carbon (HCO3(-)) transporter
MRVVPALDISVRRKRPIAFLNRDIFRCIEYISKLMLLTISVLRNSIATRQAITPCVWRAGLLITLTTLGIALVWLPLPLAAAGLLGTIAAVVIVLYPIWGLIVLIPLIPFSSLVSVQVGVASVGGMEALLVLILVAWLLRMTTRRQIVFPHPPLLLPWLLWLGVIMVSWVGALSLGDALTESLKWLEMLALYLFIVANVERRHLPWLVGAILLAGTAQAGLGLYQFLFRAGPEGFLLFGGRFLRAYGSFRQPNPYAGYLGLVLPIAYSLALWGLGVRQADRRPPTTDHRPPTGAARYSLLLTPYSLIAFGLMLAALYASQSRGAWIGFAAALATVSLARGGRTAALFGLVVAVLAIMGAMGGLESLPPVVVQRFSDALTVLKIPDIATAEVTYANFATIERLAHLRAALDMWRDHPWLGVGFGNYATIYPAYAIGRWLNPLGHAHNYYLNVGAETGLVGLVAYGLLWLAAFGLGWGAVRRSSGFERAVAAGGVGVLVHLTVHNLVDNLFVQGMYLHVAIVLGLLCLTYYSPNWKSQTRIDNSSRQA